MPPAIHIFLSVAAAVLFVVIATVRWKLHPFLSLLASSILTGLLLDMPFREIIPAMGKGFGDMAATIGIIIALGSMIGVYLEESGAALAIAWRLHRAAGKSNAGLAMSMIGALVGIPVFCDSGFIMLSAPARRMAALGGKPDAVLPLSAATGLYATHVLVPPTPGPLAAAGNLGAAGMLGTVIPIGLLMALPAVLAGYAWARHAGPSIIQESAAEKTTSEDPQSAERPPLLHALTPILLPVLLIMAGNAARILLPGTTVGDVLQVTGNPIIALGLGLVSCIVLFRRHPRKIHAEWMNRAVNQAGPIVLITCAGGSFGAILKAAPIDQLMAAWISAGRLTGLALLPVLYLVAAALKVSQGSSTASMIIASSLAAPLLPSLGIDTPLQLSLLVSVIGAGAMTVSHTNDSYFWVVSRFSGLSVQQTLRGLTVASGWMGLAVLAAAMAIWMFAVN